MSNDYITSGIFYSMLSYNEKLRKDRRTQQLLERRQKLRELLSTETIQYEVKCDCHVIYIHILRMNLCQCHLISGN